MSAESNQQTEDTRTGVSVSEATARFTELLAAEGGNQEGEGATRAAERESEEAPEEDTLEADEESDEEEILPDDEEADDDEGSDEDEEADDDEADEDEEEPETYTVKVDGEEVQVTRDELINGYTRQADYTRKTQAVAEERKALQAEAEAVRTEREQYAELLSSLQKQLEGQGSGLTDADWERLYKDDPVEWVRQKELARERDAKLEAAKAEQKRLAEQESTEHARKLAEHLVEERETLTRAIPSWVDEKGQLTDKGKEEQAAILAYGQEQGFSEEEMRQVYDHRALVLMRKAMLYDRASSKRQNLRSSKGKKGPKTAKPGATSGPGKGPKRKATEQARKRFADTHSTHDAAAVIATLDLD